MYTRATSDYSPTMKGSREENEAIHARKEMMAQFSQRQPKAEATRKTWRQRMRDRAKGFDVARDEFKPAAKKAAKPRKPKTVKEPKVKTKVESKGKKAAKA